MSPAAEAAVASASVSKGSCERPLPPAAALLSTYQTLPATVTFTVRLPVTLGALVAATLALKLSAPVKPAGGV